MTSLKALESRDLYTVGWIAALPIERAAAIAMFDDIHTKPLDFDQPLNDTNSYTWGRIGEHNIVLASLAAGVYGLVSAATTAMPMLSSFPQIRFGLLVGIGAGIARPDQGRDIRLGDIAVSQPDGKSGGLIQYDLEKVVSDQESERRDFLDRPPEVLLKALGNLQAHHRLMGSSVPKFLDDMVKRYPNLAEPEESEYTYLHQGIENDRLFNATYDHIPGMDCCNCDHNAQIHRSKRVSTKPKIHYGAVASGNKLIKDAAARDEIIKKIGEKCICFEMEAAGLMNSFPCLVVRGICDYADSHKNDRWQPYAAATAAAFAKELLGYVPSQDLQTTKTAIDMMKSQSVLKRFHPTL